MGLDCAWGDELSDLGVGAAAGGEKGYSIFAGGQRVAAAERVTTWSRTGDEQFLTGPFGERNRAVLVSEVEAAAEMLSRAIANAPTERGAKLDERACVRNRRGGFPERIDRLREQVHAIRVAVGNAERAKGHPDTTAGSPALSELQLLGGEADCLASVTDGNQGDGGGRSPRGHRGVVHAPRGEPLAGGEQILECSRMVPGCGVKPSARKDKGRGRPDERQLAVQTVLGELVVCAGDVSPLDERFDQKRGRDRSERDVGSGGDPTARAGEGLADPAQL